jgi:hypothetical protein
LLKKRGKEFKGIRFWEKKIQHRRISHPLSIVIYRVGMILTSLFCGSNERVYQKTKDDALLNPARQALGLMI